MILATRRLATAIFFIGLFAMAVRVSVDSDTFWHLRAGTWMLENRRLLNFDVFSHTRFGQPWINHSWLSEIPMAAIFAAFGYAGLNLATAIVVWLTFFVVYQSGEGGSYLRIFAVLLAAAASAVYWSARPQIVTLLLTAIFNYILILYRWRGVNRLWLLPVLMIAWVNLHGGFAIGFILLTVVLGGEIVDGFRQRTLAPTRKCGVKRMERITWVVGIGLACAAAACVNPYGPQMLLYPFKTVSIGALQNYIQEWQSPNFHVREAQVFIALWLATFGAVGFSKRRLDVADFLLFAIFTVLALLAGRNIAAFAVVAAPILMRYADSIIAELQAQWPKLKLQTGENASMGAARSLGSRHCEGRAAPRSNLSYPAQGFLAPLRGARNDNSGVTGELTPRAGLETTFRGTLVLNWILLIAIAIAAAVKVSLPLGAAENELAVARTLPVGAANYLKANPPSGLMFNSYNFGGYLAWALYPDVPVYVDGRTDLYDDQFLNEYLNAYLAGPGWEQALIEHHIGAVLVESGAPIVRELQRRPDWAVRYRDSLAVVLVRVGK